MLQSLWESVKVNEDKGTIASLTESMYKAVKCVRIINEKADLPEQDLTKAVEMLSKAKRSLAALQKLPDGEDKRKHVKRVEDNIEKIHSFVNRIVQQQVDMENEELDAFDVDEYFNNKGAMEDPCSCNDDLQDDNAYQSELESRPYNDPRSYREENEEVGVAYSDPSGDFAVIRGRSGRYKAIGKGEFKGAVEPKVFDDLESAIRHGERCCNLSVATEDEELGVAYKDPEDRFIVMRGRSGRYKAVGKGEFKGQITPSVFDHVEDAIDHAYNECDSLMSMEDEEPRAFYDREDTLAPDWQQRKDAATRDEFGTGYAKADDDHLSYRNGSLDAVDDMEWKNDPELSRNYHDEFDPDDIMVRGQRDYDHDADDSFDDDMTDEEGGEWMDVVDPETADDDYHENEEQSKALRRSVAKKLRNKMGMEDEESCSRRRMRESVERGSFVDYLVKRTK